MESEMRPQPHGGALRNGGTNKGGTGRPSSEIRRMCKEGFADALPVIVKIAKGLQPTNGNPDPSPSEITRALDVLGKYGLGEQKVEVTEADIFVALGDVLPQCGLSKETCDEVLAKLHAHLKGG